MTWNLKMLTLLEEGEEGLQLLMWWVAKLYVKIQVLARILIQQNYMLQVKVVLELLLQMKLEELYQLFLLLMLECINGLLLYHGILLMALDFIGFNWEIVLMQMERLWMRVVLIQKCQLILQLRLYAISLMIQQDGKEMVTVLICSISRTVQPLVKRLALKVLKEMEVVLEVNLFSVLMLVATFVNVVQILQMHTQIHSLL